MNAPKLSGVAERWRGALARSALRGSTGLTALALVVGVGAGLGAVAFRYMILGFTELFTGHRDYSAAGHAANPLVPGLGGWFVVVVPVIGGLIYGPLVSRFAPEARGHGVPEVMLAVNRLGGRMRPQVPIVKSLASALCIGTGGSVGREGPIVQIGSALGSVIGQVLRVPESQLRLLVACGQPSEAGLAAQRTLGVDIRATRADGDTVLRMPTVLIVDRDHMVRFADIHPNYTARTEVADILAALETLPD